MKKAIICSIFISLILISVLFFNIVPSDVDHENMVFSFNSDDLDIVHMILLPAGKKIEDILISSWNYSSIVYNQPDMVFYRTDNQNNGFDSEIVYTDVFNYDIIIKGGFRFIRLFIPSVFYKDGYKFVTSSIILKFCMRNVVYGSVAEIDKQFIDYTVLNKDAVETYVVKGEEDEIYQTQREPYEYMIITNEILWNTINGNFKNWKISNDNKIDDILIINVSDIISDSENWINGSYSDSVNFSNGNPWIDDDKEIISHFLLFNDTQCKIRNYIRYCYENHDTRYVLLAGNKDIVPPRMVASRASGDGCSIYDNDMSHACDMYYACLHKNMNNNTDSYWMDHECCGSIWDDIDWGFDLCVGRVPVDTVIEMNNWINKTKNYVIGNSQGNYLSNVIVAAKNNANAITNSTWFDQGGSFAASIGRQLIPINNLSVINNMNLSSSQHDIIYDYCNGDISGYDGINMILNSGHADFHSGRLWEHYQPALVTNINTPNFVYTEGCHSGGFGTTTITCIEDWISDDGSIFAGISNSAYGWFGASTFFVEEFLSEMFNETVGNLTRSFCSSHNKAREIQGHSIANGVWAMIYKETNFFGDPALEFQWGEIGPQFIDIDGGVNGTVVYNSTPIFNWTATLDTSEYRLMISTNVNFTNIIVNLTNINQYNYPSNCVINDTRVSFLLPNEYALSSGRYYCKVESSMKES